MGLQKAPLLIVKPPKPIAEMTKDEFNTWSKAVYDEMVDRFEKAMGETPTPLPSGPSGAAPTRPDGVPRRRRRESETPRPADG